MADIYETPEGLKLALGYRRRPFDPRSAPYEWVANLPTAAPAVDLTKSVFFWGAGPDVRWPCEDQSSMGSCAAFAGGNAAAEALAMAGGAPVDLMKNWLYWEARKKENAGQPNPNDVGSDPADILDFCMSGVPAASIEAGGYVPNAAESFDQYTPQATLRPVASFHPFYPQSGDFRSLVWAALAAGYPVVLASLWTQAFYSPTNGILPQGQTPAQEVGGHAYRCYGYIPPFGPYTQGLLACRNNWTPAWGNAQASGLPNAQPGDFYVPCEYAQNGIIEVGYTVVGAGSAPNPSPKPQPQPQALAVTPSVAGPVTAGSPAAFTCAGSGAAQPYYAMNFGDGSPTTAWQTSPAFSHTYQAAGQYTATAWLGDAARATNNVSAPATVTVTVAAKPNPQPQPTPVAPTIAKLSATLTDNTVRQVYP